MYDQNPPTIQEIPQCQGQSQDTSKQIKTKTKAKKNSMHISTLNTRTLRTPESLQELELAMSSIKWDILGIAEMRRDGEGIEEREDYIMYHKGEIAGHRGVGFLVKIKHKSKIKEFEGIDDRIAILHLKIPSYKNDWTLVQIYAPTEQADKNDTERFYDKLSEIARKYSKNHIVYMGDFNAQVGVRGPGEEFVMGSFGHGKRSTNGNKLISFLLENNLFLLNSMFRKKPKTKWTWISPDSKYKNEIDYIITNKAKSFTDTHVVQNLNFNTNHRMVRSCLNLHPPKLGRTHLQQSDNPPTEKQYKEMRNDVKARFLESSRSDLDAIGKYNNLESKLREITKVTITTKKHKNLTIW